MGNRQNSLSSGRDKRKRRAEDGVSRKKSSTGRVSDVSVLEISDDSALSSYAAASRVTLLSDQFKLCEFPPGGARDSVTVSVMDYKTLEQDTYLNDIIIDFYLTYLLHTVLSPEERKQVHVFSSMFYKRLTSARNNEDEGLSPSQKMHSRVKRWTKNLNLFKKELVIVPICERSHWYLIIIIKPGEIAIDAESRENGEPLFLVLDSLESVSGKKSVKNVRHYIKQEWLAKYPGRPEVSFSKKRMKTVRPMKPEQENFTDCGLFLLHYVEKIFKK